MPWWPATDAASGARLSGANCRRVRVPLPERNERLAQLGSALLPLHRTCPRRLRPVGIRVVADCYARRRSATRTTVLPERTVERIHRERTIDRPGAESSPSASHHRGLAGGWHRAGAGSRRRTCGARQRPLVPLLLHPDAMARRRAGNGCPGVHHLLAGSGCPAARIYAPFRTRAGRHRVARPAGGLRIHHAVRR